MAQEEALELARAELDVPRQLGDGERVLDVALHQLDGGLERGRQPGYLRETAALPAARVAAE